MTSIHVADVAQSAGRFIEVWALWTWASGSGTRSLQRVSPTRSWNSGSAGMMLRRLSRTPLLKRRGLIRKRRYTR